eukprot:s1761_g13.t1
MSDGPQSALIIKEKWALKLLNGEKSWEIRGSSTAKRGTIAIAISGTGKLYGEITLVDAKMVGYRLPDGRLVKGDNVADEDFIANNFERHRIPELDTVDLNGVECHDPTDVPDAFRHRRAKPTVSKSLPPPRPSVKAPPPELRGMLAKLPEPKSSPAVPAPAPVQAAASKSASKPGPRVPAPGPRSRSPPRRASNKAPKEAEVTPVPEQATPVPPVPEPKAPPRVPPVTYTPTTVRVPSRVQPGAGTGLEQALQEESATCL